MYNYQNEEKGDTVKKVIVVVVAGLLVFSLGVVIGCGGGEDTSTPAGETQEEQGDASEAQATVEKLIKVFVNSGGIEKARVYYPEIATYHYNTYEGRTSTNFEITNVRVPGLTGEVDVSVQSNEGNRATYFLDKINGTWVIIGNHG